MKNNFSKIYVCLKPFRNGLSIFLGILFLGLMSCSSPTTSPVSNTDDNTHTISFKLNGGSFISPQITNLKVVDNTAIEETRLGEIISYPPTGPKPNIQAVTRDIFEWRNNGTKYDFSTPVSNDLTLEAVWSNSCGKVETFHPTNRYELRHYFNGPEVFVLTTNLNHVDTSAITDMINLFSREGNYFGFKNGEKRIKAEVYCWNTSKVTDMQSMFSRSIAFNGDISSWNVSNVNNMNDMFYNAWAFNQDIGDWDVANVTSMWSMFFNASAFNQDIGSWNVSNARNTLLKGNGSYGSYTGITSMFYGASAFNRDYLTNWDLSFWELRYIGS